MRIGVDLGGTKIEAALPRLWEQWVFSDQAAIRIVPPLHGDSSGVRGAAWLWREEGGP